MKGVKTNPELMDLIGELKAAGRERREDIWRDVAERLERSRAQMAQVNVGKLNKVVRGGEIALVPGKVLGAGTMDRSISVAALSFSNSAYQKLLASGSEAMYIGELLKNNPDVRKIRIVG
jgi:large subunit ribosomal protein L18e